MDAALRRLQGGVLLLALAFIGWELSALTSIRPAAPEVLAAIDEAGNGSVRVYEQRRGGVTALAAARTMLARTAVEFDPARSLLVFKADGAPRVAPASARTILVGADRRLQFLPEPLPAEVLRHLVETARAPAADFALGRWFRSPPVAQLLTRADERLRRFWE
jgi:acyl-CoA synthetase (AMP-forming)/AMP-acid ligase II